VEIAGRKVGPGFPCLIVAEAGVNHNGSLEMAKRLVDTAVGAGVDVVKFQSFKAERLAASSAPKADYQLSTTGGGESQLEMLRRLELSETAQKEIKDYCREKGILFMSTPFDEGSADFLEGLGVGVFKIPSGEITNLQFLAHVARKGKPMIVSTGMSSVEEVEVAVRTIQGVGNQQLVLLHCVSRYPTEPAEVNLRAMGTMEATFHVPVGYSDHTMGVPVALAAVALGACVIEKHFTLDRSLPGPDHQASLEPKELADLVHGIRIVEASLGHGRKEPTLSEASTAAVARKSLVAARDIAAGSALTEQDITVKRPGTGLAPTMLSHLLGRRAVKDIPADTLLALEMFR
jgi:N-acetylneuraminate synthase